VLQWSAPPGEQVWTLNSTGPTPSPRFREQPPLLDVRGAAWRTARKSSSRRCNGGTTRSGKITSSGGGFRLQAVHSGKCLDVKGERERTPRRTYSGRAPAVTTNLQTQTARRPLLRRYPSDGAPFAAGGATIGAY